MAHGLQTDLHKTLVLALISILRVCSATIFSYNSNKLRRMHPFLYPIESWKIQTALQYFTPPLEK